MISPPNIGHVTEHYCSFRNIVLSNALLSGDLFQLSLLIIRCDENLNSTQRHGEASLE
jgi:hypothetical protein